MTTTKAHELAAKADIVNKTIELMSEPDVHKEDQGAWNKLQECQRSTTEPRAKWLESVTRYKAKVEGDTDAAKTLETMNDKEPT